jgi:hypothetical protein
MPRRRRSRAVEVEQDDDVEHGLAMRIFLHSPKDVIAGALALLAIGAIVVNALFMQAGRHPAPMFGTVVTLPAVASVPANPLPRPRPLEAEIPLPEARPVEAKAADPKAADPKTADPMANLVKTTSSVQPTMSNIPRPPLAVPVSTRVDSVPVTGSHRVAAVQRALAENGYGQLKPTGVIGPDTQAAIQRFERARRLPVTGQVSDRLLRELASMMGHPVE